MSEPHSSRPDILLLLICDCDPDRRRFHFPTSTRPGERFCWRGVAEGIPQTRSALDGLRDDERHPPRVSWCIRSDAQIAETHNSYGWCLENFDGLWNRLDAAGDSIGWHFHHWRYCQDQHTWYQERNDTDWMIENLRNGWNAFSKFGTPPVIGRAGWSYHDNATMTTLDSLGLAVDISATPGQRNTGVRLGAGLCEGYFDWSRCPKHPYNPDRNDYQRKAVGPDALKILEVPMTPVRSSALDIARRMARGRNAGNSTGSPTIPLILTLHPLMLHFPLKRIIRDAASGFLSPVIIGYFHPDELLDGKGRLNDHVYSKDNLVANIRQIQRLARQAGCRLYFRSPEVIRFCGMVPA